LGSAWGREGRAPHFSTAGRASMTKLGSNGGLAPIFTHSWVAWWANFGVYLGGVGITWTHSVDSGPNFGVQLRGTRVPPHHFSTAGRAWRTKFGSDRGAWGVCPYFVALLGGLVAELWGKLGRRRGYSDSLGGFGAKLRRPTEGREGRTPHFSTAGRAWRTKLGSDWGAWGVHPYFVALLGGLVGGLWGKFGRSGGHWDSLGGLRAKLWGPTRAPHFTTTGRAWRTKFGSD